MLMKKTLLILFVIMVITQIVSGQTLSPKVIATGGGYFTGGNNSLSWTMGETFTQTLTAQSNMLSHGFQQPEMDILTNAISGSPLCTGATVNVSFTATGYYSAGNVFTAQLSNASGSFANAVNIGSLSGTIPGTINATIPINSPAGSGYRIRVVSNLSVYTGKDNGTDLIINIPSVYYADVDGDGYGNANATTQACGTLTGYVSDSADCNDGNASIHPGANDVCNSIDDNCDGIVDENAITATVTPAGNYSYCMGTTVILTANSGSGLIYQWIKSSKNISGTTNITYSTNKAGSYKVKETNSFGCSSTSAVTTLTQVSKPAATITALGNLNICTTNSVVLQANSGTGFTYQWLKNAVAISGATNQTYTATAKGTYKCIVTNSSGCSSTSNVLKVTKSCKEDWVEDQATASFNVYPNPSDGNFMVTADWNTNLNSEATVILYNALGQIVYSHKTEVTDGKLSLEIKSEASRVPGIYILKVIAGGEQFTSRVVIQ